MKIALCFSGHIRDLEVNYNYWKELLKEHDVFVFGSFWDDYENEEKGDTFLNFEKLYSPVKYEVEKYSSFKDSTLSVASKRVSVPICSFHPDLENMARNFIQLSMFYKIWRCNMISKVDNYDIVIRARTDTHLLCENFEFEKTNSLKIPVGHYFCNRDNHPNYGEHSMGIEDIFAYGPPDIMDYYSFVYLKVMTYFEEGYSLLTAEHCLNVHLSKARILIDMIPYYLTVTREWREGGEFNHNGWVTELYRNIYWSDEVYLPLNPELTSFRNPNKISFEN